MTGLSVVTIPDGATPATRVRIDTAVGAIGTGRTLGCAHLRPGSPAVVCAEHPASGLMCPRCAARHAERHPAAVELACDECGTQAARIYPVTTRDLHRVDAWVHVPRSGRRRWWGRLVVSAVGLCPACLPGGSR